MNRALFLLLVLCSSPSFAASRPVLPEPGEDMKLTGGKSVVDFFKAREGQTACRTELSALKARYKAGQPVRAALLRKMEACGECALRPIENVKVPTAGRTEVWYVSDGSCQIEPDSAAFARMTESLLHLKQYPQRNGGFTHLLEFVGVDNATGEILPDVDKVESFPFFSFVAIKGPEMLGLLTAPSYYIRNDLARTPNEFTLKFEGVKAPRGFQTPDVFLTGPGGKKTLARQIKLSSVHGMWYLTSNGYLRYHTAADFGLSLQFASDLAHDILLDTLVQLSERAEAK